MFHIRYVQVIRMDSERTISDEIIELCTTIEDSVSFFLYCRSPYLCGCQRFAYESYWNNTPPIPESDASVYKRMSNLLSSMKYINGHRDIAILVSKNALVLF